MIVRVLLGILLWCGAADAACSVQVGATVKLRVAGTVILAPVVVNGIEGTFVVDTGSRLTVVTPDAVDRFGLALDEWTSTTMGGVGGVERRRNANPRSITLGGTPLRRRGVAGDSTLRVATMPRGMVGGYRVDGLLGRDFMSMFDLDLDLPRQSLTLYNVRDCTGRFLPWTEDYVSVPVESPADSALWVPVTLDGVRLRALLDTGASATVVAAPGMAHLALGLDRLMGDPSQVTGGLGPHTVTMWRHRFREMRIGDETFTARAFLVAPIQLNPVSDLLLGADWLLPHRVWISYATHQLFLMK